MEVQIEEGWKSVLKPQFEQPYFHLLIDFVKSEYKHKTIYPSGKLIFNAFNTCPWDHLKLVILGQDPYINPGQAMGLCFSVPDGESKPPSLQNIFKELSADLEIPVPTSGNLERWSKEGVLLLNTVLTVQAGLSNSHQNRGWETFTDSVIRLISSEKKSIVFLLWGSQARKKAELIDQKRHFILESPHPSPLSAHRGFFGNHHFSLANQYLISKGISPINW